MINRVIEKEEEETVRSAIKTIFSCTIYTIFLSVHFFFFLWPIACFAVRYFFESACCFNWWQRWNATVITNTRSPASHQQPPTIPSPGNLTMVTTMTLAINYLQFNTIRPTDPSDRPIVILHFERRKALATPRGSHQTGTASSSTCAG